MSTSPVQRGVLRVKITNESVSTPLPISKTKPTRIYEKNGSVLSAVSKPISIPSKKVEVLSAKPKAGGTPYPAQDIREHIPKGGIFALHLNDSEEENFENVINRQPAPTHLSQPKPSSPIEDDLLSLESSAEEQAPPQSLQQKTASVTTGVFRERVQSPVQKENAIPKSLENTSREKKDKLGQIEQTKPLDKSKKNDASFLQFDIEL